MNKIKEDLRLKEALKEAEAKKRGIYTCVGDLPDDLLIPRLEKIEDAKAKAAVKAQIEADKKARAEKAAREKALRDGQPVIDSSSSTGPSRPAPATTLPKKEFAETRLAIRMSSGGQQYTTTLPCDARML
jgi:UBX domain-containing protein 1/4